LVATTLLLAAVLPRLTERYAVHDEAPDDGKPATNSLRMLRDVVADNWRGVPLLLLAIVLYTFGINAVETFFSLYGRTVLGIREETALSILGVFFITYIIASVPAGAVGQRFGRRQTMSAGLALISLLILGAFVLRSVPALLVVMPLGGVAWALVNTNALPAVLGMSPAGHAASTVGLYYAATTLASILSPVVNGRLIDLGGGDYNLAILSTSIVAGLAALVLVAMGRVRAAGVESWTVNGQPKRAVSAATRPPLTVHCALLTASNACPRSAMMSAGSSMPMERRSKPSVMPRRARSAGGTARWLAITGYRASEYTSPSVVAGRISRSASRKR
jgi:MFS family permease